MSDDASSPAMSTTTPSQEKLDPFRLNSRYTLMRVAGQGGMATVYEAWDELLCRPVAVKSLQPHLRSDERVVQRFWAEAEVLASMDHPGMPPVFDQGDDPALGPYYVMKFVRGQNLSTRLKWRTPSDFRTRGDLDIYIGIFQKVCEAMGYAHGKQIVHRDLKPANIMVGDHGEVLIMDWGIAKRLDKSQDQVTGIGQVLGTLAHMSPEQAGGRSHEVDARSDVFALGIMLYNILTLELPFTASSPAELREKVIHAHPEPPRARQHAVAPVLSGICMKALSKSPDERYATARDLAEDIQLFRASRATVSYRMSPLDRFKAWGMRHPAITAVTLVVFVLLGSIGAMEWRARHNWAQERDRVTEAALAYMDALQPEIDRLETQINEVGARLAEGTELTAELRASLESERTGLQVAREALLDYNREVIAYTVGRFVDTLAPLARDVDPALLARIREYELARIQALVRTRQMHKADYAIYDARQRAPLLGWSGQQSAELDRIQAAVQQAIADDPGTAARDWAATDPRRIYMEYESSQEAGN